MDGQERASTSTGTGRQRQLGTGPVKKAAGQGCLVAGQRQLCPPPLTGASGVNSLRTVGSPDRLRVGGPDFCPLRPRA